MRTEKFQEALDMYSKAIDLDGSNPVFYCNRAAAHSKMNAHHLAIEDCQRAIDMDPSYSKAKLSLIFETDKNSFFFCDNRMNDDNNTISDLRQILN